MGGDFLTGGRFSLIDSPKQGWNFCLYLMCNHQFRCLNNLTVSLFATILSENNFIVQHIYFFPVLFYILRVAMLGCKPLVDNVFNLFEKLIIIYK